MKNPLKNYPISIAVLLTAVILGGCAAGPPQKRSAALEPDCVPQNAAMHCISGDRLRSYGYGSTEEALRLALFPWVSM